jgi:hypothetical protein
VVALSARQLPATLEYTQASRPPVHITVPTLAASCRAQNGIAHPTDTIGYLQ